MKLVLASGSKARQSMLQHAGYDFEIVPSGVDEDPIKHEADRAGLSLPELALKLARAKAEDVSKSRPDNLVIGSDQVLGCEGSRLSKVASMSGAHAQLKRLQGKTHQLHSAVAVCRNGDIVFKHVDTADLTIWPMTDLDIETYLQDAGSDVLGSVGCYQIEGKGIRLFEGVNGNHFTIMGMPLIPLLGYLRLQCKEMDR